MEQMIILIVMLCIYLYLAYFFYTEICKAMGKFIAALVALTNIIAGLTAFSIFALVFMQTTQAANTLDTSDILMTALPITVVIGLIGNLVGILSFFINTLKLASPSIKQDAS